MKKLRWKNKKSLENYLVLKNQFVSEVVINEVMTATTMGNIKEKQIVFIIFEFLLVL